MEKERHVDTGWWIHVLCTPFLITSSPGCIKRGSAHHCGSEMYVCGLWLSSQTFSTQGSLRRCWESVHRQSAGFPVKHAANTFTGTMCYRGTWRCTNRWCYLAIQNSSISCQSDSAVNKGWMLSTRAGNWPKQLLWSHFNVNFYKKLKIIRKRCNKNNCATSASNVWVEIKVHFRSFKRLYFSHARWKLIEGSWNACDIFTEQDPARNRLKIMKRSAEIIVWV